jgi:acyl carrier protein
MDRQGMVVELERLLELQTGFLSESMRLAQIPNWDSMQALSFILLVERTLHRVIDGAEVSRARTVGDLLDGVFGAELRG